MSRRLLRATPLLVVLVEVLGIIAIGRLIGPGWTVLALLGCAVLGVVLLVRQGRAAFAALRAALSSGRMPGPALIDAVLVVAGGVLLIVPGFVTALVGAFLAVPFTRSVTRQWLARVARRRVELHTGIVRGEVVPGQARDAGRHRQLRGRRDHSTADPRDSEN